jgi:hypothetical protein
LSKKNNNNNTTTTMLAGTIFLYCSTPFILLVLLFNYTDPYPLRFWYNISIEPIYSTAHNINVQHATHAPHTTSLCGTTHCLFFCTTYKRNRWYGNTLSNILLSCNK